LIYVEEKACKIWAEKEVVLYCKLPFWPFSAFGLFLLVH